MEKRVLLAVVLSFIVLYGYQALFSPPPRPKPQATPPPSSAAPAKPQAGPTAAPQPAQPVEAPAPAAAPESPAASARAAPPSAAKPPPTPTSMPKPERTTRWKPLQVSVGLAPTAQDLGSEADILGVSSQQDLGVILDQLKKNMAALDAILDETEQEPDLVEKLQEIRRHKQQHLATVEGLLAKTGRGAAQAQTPTPPAASAPAKS